MIMYAAYSSNYQTLRLSGSGYPSGTYKFMIDMATDPTEGGTVIWRGPFNAHASQIRNVVIEDEIYVDYANSLFDGLVNCTSIQGINNIHGNLLNTTRMFANTPKLTQPITLDNLISINCLDATEMFAGAGSREIVLNNINMKNCTSTKGMFKNAAAQVIEMTSINTNSVRYADEMFAGCTNLTNIYGTGGYFDFSQAITSTNMFAGSSLLTNWPNLGLDKFGAIPIDNGGYINMSPYSLEMVDVRIRLKYDTKDNWFYYDPVLLEGEMAIESDTNRIKVGDGVHHYSELDYFYGVKIDHKTILDDSETTELYVPIDEDTIYVDTDGKIKAKEQLHADQITIFSDADGKLYLDLDDKTIKVNAAGQLESNVEVDNKTIKQGINGLYVPIDNVTLFVENGILKSKGDLTPGKGLEWNATSPRVLDVKIDGKTITTTGHDGPTGSLSVSYDGRTIYWDDGAGDNGALKAMEVTNTDGTVKVTEGAHKWDISVPIDNDTIKLEGGVIKATTQVPKVDGETIILEDDKLKVNADNDTIYVEGGKLKAKQTPEVEVDEITIIKNSEGKLEATKQMPDIDNKTLVVKNDLLQVAIDNQSIMYDSENEWIEVDGPELVARKGVRMTGDSEYLFIEALIDGVTITLSSEGALQADAFPKPLVPDTYLYVNCEGEVEWKDLDVDVDEKTIIKKNGLITANIDEDTIIYNSEENHIEVPHVLFNIEDGLYVREDSELYIGVNVDKKTIFINSQGELEGAPNVLVDGKTIVIDSENIISTNIDKETIIYNEDKEWLEVPNKFFDAENGLYLRDTSETIYIGIDLDGETLFINSEGKLEGAPNVLVDGTTIIQDENDIISVHYDHDTIVYNSEVGLEVDGIEITPVAPAYIIDNSEEGGRRFLLGVGYDNASITLNDKNELQTAVGGGWRKDPEEYIIATGTNVRKNRHHMLPDDDADYYLDTVHFPNYLQDGTTIEASVTHDASFMDDSVTLKWNAKRQMWIYDGRHYDSEAHPLDPHGYSIFVGKEETRVQLHEDYEIDPETLTCTIRYGGHNWTKEYIDNQFVKVDGETIFVNSEGELQAGEQLKAGKWLIVSEGYIGLGKLCQGLAYNEESDCIYVKDATDSEIGGVKIDNETLKINGNGQLAFNSNEMLDRGLDASTGKIGHTNAFEGDLRQAGDPTSTVGIRWDEYGHLAEVERYDIPTMTGASSTNNGTRGFVPAPAAGDNKKFLRGDGTWSGLVESGLFSVIETEGQWWVGTDRRTRVFSAEPNANQLVIAPLGFTVDRDTESIDCIYMTEIDLGHITITARSNTQAETLVKCKAKWLVMNV